MPLATIKLLSPFRLARRRRPTTRRCPRKRWRTLEALESRYVLSSLTGQIVVQSVSTADSQSITLRYDVDAAPLASAFQVGVYRSEDNQFDPTHLRTSDETIATLTVGGSDDNGQNALAVGTHSETMSLPAKLGIDPLHSFVYAVADPGNQLQAGSTQQHMAFFHKYVLGVVTHGLVTVPPFQTLATAPAWISEMANSLVQTDHYQKAIPFDWAQLSGSTAPGTTDQAASLMVSAIESAAQTMVTSPTDVVDIHLIGHSRGTVVIAQALTDMLSPSANLMPALAAGYKQATLLDPHPAHQTPNGPDGQPIDQWFSPGTAPLLSATGVALLDDFQFAAADPPVVIPKGVDKTEVFYQHTPSTLLTPAATEVGEATVFNLWGQVPIIDWAGAVDYYDLTGPNLGHSEVWMWYRDHVVLTDALAAPPASNPGLHVPASNVQAAYVRQVYVDVLARPADDAGLAYWVPQLKTGLPRATVIAAIDHSDEYFGTVIRPAYLTYLGRPADAAGLSYWTAQMHAGLTDEGLEAGFISSDEFYAKAGGSDSAWVDALYGSFLGRPADQQGKAYWLAELQAGQTRTQVAQGFAAGNERESQRIESDYFHYLGRDADASGLAYWLSRFAAGATNEDLIAGFVASDEYFQAHTGTG